MTGPSRRHSNIIRNRGRSGHNEDQLARSIGITPEAMRGWAKKDPNFAAALRAALNLSREYWERSDQKVREREEQERKLADARSKRGHLPHRQPGRTALEPVPPRVPNKLTRTQRRAIRERERQQLDAHRRQGAERAWAASQRELQKANERMVAKFRR